MKRVLKLFLLITLSCSLHATKTALQIALEDRNDSDEAIKLIKKGADINSSIHGEPIIVYACRLNDSRLLTLLITQGADVNQEIVTSHSKTTPLAPAIIASYIDNIKILLEYGADPNAEWQENENVTTALYHACLNSNIDIITLLLEYGADPNKANTINGKSITAKEIFLEEQLKIKQMIETGSLSKEDAVKSYHFIQNYETEATPLFATKSNQEKIAGIKKITPIKPFNPNNPNTTSWSTASKIGISTLAIAAAVAGYYEYKKSQTKKKLDEKKKAAQEKKEKLEKIEQSPAVA